MKYEDTYTAAIIRAGDAARRLADEMLAALSPLLTPVLDWLSRRLK